MTRGLQRAPGPGLHAIPLFWRLLAAAFWLCLASLPAPPVRAESPGQDQDLARETLSLRTRSGVHKFDVELANTPQARMRGLMFREEVPPGTGMLFDFGQEQVVGFWMKNTPSALDMIFIAATGRIMHIVENTVPHSLETISPPMPVRFVLEVAAGTARAIALRPGDIAKSPTLARAH